MQFIRWCKYAENRRSRAGLILMLSFALAAAGLAWPINGSAARAGNAAPDITGENWLNSKPLTIGALKGRVILIEFWTYG